MIPTLGIFGVLVALWGMRPWKRSAKIEPWMSEFFSYESDDVIDHRLRER